MAKTDRRKVKHLTVLRRDKRLLSILESVKPYEPRREKDLYFGLLKAICGQQLSVKAAQTIWDRFVNLFPNRYPDPALVLEIDIERIRKVGMSYQKAGYVKGVAQFSKENNITLEHLSSLGDDEIITYLTSIKGVGRWTVEMLLMFCLDRKDVFPVQDQGIINGMRKLYRLKEKGKLLRSKCTLIAEKWRPYRSHACYYIWPYIDLRTKGKKKSG